MKGEKTLLAIIDMPEAKEFKEIHFNRDTVLRMNMKTNKYSVLHNGECLTGEHTYILEAVREAIQHACFICPIGLLEMGVKEIK